MKSNKSLKIFLDIDGVLSNHFGLVEEWKTYKFRHQDKIIPYFNLSHRRERLFGSMAMVCKYNIEEFNIFCRVIGFENIEKIIITSTWRKSYSLKTIATVLYLQGLEFEICKKISDQTKTKDIILPPYSSGINYSKEVRHREIEDYISSKGLNQEDCIIVDDIDLKDRFEEMYYDFCDYRNGFEYKGARKQWL